MPPKTRASRISKASKENFNVVLKNKTKTTSKATKPPRKALADKTNSASDDNESFMPPQPSKMVVECEQDNLLVKQRPRRDRRVPSRFVECNMLQNLSNSKNASGNEESITTPVKNVPVVVISPLKTPITKFDSSLTAQRPKRICKLPSKFDDHSISPSKFVPVLPSYASTPKQQTKENKVNQKNQNGTDSPKEKLATNKAISTKATRKKTVRSKINNSPDNSKADTNNNPKRNLPRNKTKNKQNTSPKVSPNDKTNASKKPVNKNFSFRILEDNKKSLKRDASKVDVYEFTYDPNEEPPPQKKKRKKPAKKREPKPKTVIFKNNYDKNLAKVLSALKNTITKPAATANATTVDNTKGSANQVNQIKPVTRTLINAEVTTIPTQEVNQTTTSTEVTTKPNIVTPVVTESSVCNTEKSHVSERNYNSVRVEDIALDFDDDYADNINYSPVNSPSRPAASPAVQNLNVLNPSNAPHNKDPLNLREDLSFFDDQPVASSSMNTSIRNPAASPWRVEFGSLPIKWQVNTYVKPNMTPAFESSFINFNDSKKKHVYTNIVPDTSEANDLPKIFDDNTSKLKQTSIISFIQEVVQKSAKKKKDKLTPIKSNSLFEDPNNTSVFNDVAVDPVTPKKNAVNSNHVTPPNKEVSTDESTEHSSIENSNEVDKENKKDKVKNSSKKKKNKDLTYFGFDDTENQDQENVSPVKKIDKRKLRALKPRSRAVLQEINSQKGPTRADVPVAIKSAPIQSSEAANKLFDDWKSASDAPVFPDKETTNVDITEVQANQNLSDDEQSVHLFEDIEFNHNLKAHRKSYGKTKKAVTFRHNSISDSDVPQSEVGEQSDSSEEDDLLDLTFKVPTMEPKKAVKKKKTKKQLLSKKEEKEVEAWAAGFNSMCEDIEEFDLVVE